MNDTQLGPLYSVYGNIMINISFKFIFPAVRLLSYCCKLKCTKITNVDSKANHKILPAITGQDSLIDSTND